MKKQSILGYVLAGACAGTVNGLFGAGGGLILVPLLLRLTDLDEHKVFHTSIAVILPICIVSLTANWLASPLPWRTSLPYLIGSFIGGISAARYGSRIPVIWLHRCLGVLIIWGGLKYLC